MAKILACVAAVVIVAGCSMVTDESLSTRPFSFTPESSQKLIVFVHGVFGDPSLTWTNRSGVSWPDLIKGDETFRDFAVAAYRYDTPFLGRTSGIEEIATRLRRQLEDEGVFRKYNEIYFVAHSMGGLVVKRMLVDLNRPKQVEKLRQVKAVLYIFTPAQGASIAELGSWLSANPQLGDMRVADLNSFLQSLENQWQDLIRERGAQPFPQSFCAYETKPTYGGMVVTRVYAATICDLNPFPVDEDHATIVKPASTDADIYKWARGRIQEASALAQEGREEVLLLPHIQYEYRSNYPEKYFRLKQVKQSLSGELESKLTLHNNSKGTLENMDIKTYIYCGDDFKKFLRPYYLNASEYLLIGSLKFSRVETQKKVTLDIIEQLRDLFRTQENLNKIILPELGQSQNLPKLSRICSNLKPANIFTDDEKLLREEFIPLVPSNQHMGREADYGFNGAMLKIILEYDANDVRFKHLLIGGLYYKYIITTQIPVPYKEAPVGTVVSGFFKADNILWKSKAKQSFSSVTVPQPVIDTVEEGSFQSNLGGPIQPGHEVTVRVEPDKAFTSAAGKFLPIPMYLWVQNNVQTPQPDPIKDLFASPQRQK